MQRAILQCEKLQLTRGFITAQNKPASTQPIVNQCSLSGVARVYNGHWGQNMGHGGAIRKLAALAAGAIALALGACSHKVELTPDNRMCDFRTIRMDLPVPASDPALLAGTPPGAMAREIATSLQVHARHSPAAPARMLSLSGGSEHGAFGAGVLAGWGGTGDLPDFEVVTGISTGSILATFAFVGDSATAVDGYTIDSESQLIHVYAKPKDGKPDIGDYLALVEHGAFADMGPLRTRLASFLTADVMAQVATRHAAGARLFVGATDADSGDAVAFDLGDMASRYVAASTAAAKAAIQSCYIDAIIASSSAPMAAPPAFIDNTMYIDGGTRYGLFAGAALEAHARAQHAAATSTLPAPITYEVINGTLDLPPRPCPKQDASLCTPDNPLGGKDGQHRPWNIMNLALNTEHILVNQVYRFSAQGVADDACEDAGCFNFLRIGDDVNQFTFIQTDPTTGLPSALTCPAWTAIDNAVDDPIEFHKRYMRCLIAYGRTKVAAAGWGS